MDDRTLTIDWYRVAQMRSGVERPVFIDMSIFEDRPSWLTDEGLIQAVKNQAVRVNAKFDWSQPVHIRLTCGGVMYLDDGEA